VWWKDVVCIRDGSSSVLGSWFSDNLRLRVGNGVTTWFWLDRWVSDVPLCEKFRRLYDLSDNKLATVAQMFHWGWGVGGEAWKWRRRLWVWEEELLEECRLFLLIVTLQVDSVDAWRWTPGIARSYTASGAYRLLTDTTQINNQIPTKLLWRKDMPLKVSVFAWRLFHNRLPSKLNLFRRGIILPEVRNCVSGCGFHESECHLFLSCAFFGHIWQLVRNWLCVHSAELSHILDHFIQFGSSTGYGKSRCSFMHLIWFATTWVIWKEKNARIFRGTENSHLQLLENVQHLSFWWFKASVVSFHYSFYNWCQNPLLCAGIG